MLEPGCKKVLNPQTFGGRGWSCGSPRPLGSSRRFSWSLGPGLGLGFWGFGVSGFGFFCFIWGGVGGWDLELFCFSWGGGGGGGNEVERIAGKGDCAGLDLQVPFRSLGLL